LVVKNKLHFLDILEKVQGKIEVWRSKTLSQAGKTVLVKVVAYFIPSYAMSSFLLPDNLSPFGYCIQKHLVGFSKRQIS